MSEFSGWRGRIERAEARLREADAATERLVKETALMDVVSNVRTTLEEAMLGFLEAVRPPPEPEAKLGEWSTADWLRLTVQRLNEGDTSQGLGTRLDNTLAHVLDVVHASAASNGITRDRVGKWLNAAQEFLDVIEPRVG